LAEKCSLKLLKKSKLKRLDFEQNSVKLSERNLKKKNCNKPKKIFEFSIISELSNEAENPKQKN